MRIADSTLSMSSSRKYSEYTGLRTGRTGRDPNSRGIYNNVSDQSLGSFQNILNRPLTQAASSVNMSPSESIRAIRLQLLHRIFDFLRHGVSISGTDTDAAVTDSLAGSGFGDALWVRTTSVSFEYYEEETTAFETTGSVKCADGRTIDFNVELSMSRSFCAVYEELTTQSYFITDPLVFNLDSDITGLSDFKFLFDLDCDGTKENISFAGAGSGFLALDLNEDGIINDGSELFGTKSGDGFADLARYDLDHNGWIDEADEIFDHLKVWTKDESGNDELISLKDADVGAIFLGSSPTQFSINDRYNRTDAYIRSTGIFLRESGGVGTVAQLDMTS